MKSPIIRYAAMSAAFASTAQGANVLVNNSFDSTPFGSAPYNTAYNVTTNPSGFAGSFTDPSSPGIVARNYLESAVGMGWQTTAGDNRIELWESGFRLIPSAVGIQFAEINANSSATLFQDVEITIGGGVDYSFYHRGRDGTDTMNITITFLGIDQLIGGGDDVNVVNQNYSTGNTAWSLYAVDDGFTSVPGGFYRFAFSAVSVAGGNLSQGNFIDEINFGVNAIPEPTVALLGSVGMIGMLRRRR